MQKGPRVPVMTKCEGCARKILTQSYMSNNPGPDVPDNRVTWYTIAAGQPAWCVACSCGHYTVHSYFPRRRDARS